MTLSWIAATYAQCFYFVFFLYYVVGNKLICNCNLAWIWGLRNETKSLDLRHALENLTCFMENKTVTTIPMNEEAERNRALKIARNQGEKWVPSFSLGNVVTPPQPYHSVTSLIFNGAVKPKEKNEAIPTEGRHVFLFYLGQDIFNGFTHLFSFILSCFQKSTQVTWLELQRTKITRVLVPRTITITMHLTTRLAQKWVEIIYLSISKIQKFQW